MKTKMLICSALLLAGTVHVFAQDSNKKRNTSTKYSNKNNGGNTKENIQTSIEGVSYQMEITNEKITAFYAEGKQIPAEQYSQYSTVIAKIKEQLRVDRLQAKKDEEMSLKDQKAARYDQEKAAKGQLRAKYDQDRAQQDQLKAKLDAEKAMKDQERAEKDQLEAKLEAEKDMKDQLQAKLDQEQAEKDQEAAKQEQEDAMKDQAAAKIDEEQAKEDQRQAKQFIADLVKDGVVSDEKNLQSIKLTSSELFVNDKKQSNNLFEKYRTKYPRFASGNFFYGSSGNGRKTIQLHR